MNERNDEKLMQAQGGTSAFGERSDLEGAEEYRDQIPTPAGPAELHFCATGRCRLAGPPRDAHLQGFLEQMIEVWNRGVRDGRSDPYAPIEALAEAEQNPGREVRAQLVCAFLQIAASALAVCRDAPDSELAALEHRVHRSCRPQPPVSSPSPE